MRRLVPFHPPTARLSVRPHENEPNAVVARRPRGSRRPHPDATFAAVRHLIEASTLSYGQIRARTGVSHATICRWARDGGWKRPPFAPRATDLMPTPRASAKLRRRTLAARLDALAERHVRELKNAFEMGEQHLDLLAEPSGCLPLRRPCNHSRHVTRAFVDRAWHFAGRTVRAALGLESASLTIEVARAIEQCRVIVDARAGRGQRFAARTKIDVAGHIIGEVLP